MSKLWGGRFQKTAEEWVDEFGASIPFDQQLVMQDLEGSIAHVTMLAEQGILSKEEEKEIKVGLQSLVVKAENGELEFSIDQEDIHLNIEHLLIEEIGEVGGKVTYRQKS